MKVNDVNISYCRALINNYPEYPCALFVNDTIRITDRTKDYLMN